MVALLVACGGTQTTTRELSVQPGERATVGVDLSSGDVLRIQASVVGDETVDIGLWLEDPRGLIAVQEQHGRAVSLSFGATTKGMHHVVVDNGYSLFAGKIVSLKLTVER